MSWFVDLFFKEGVGQSILLIAMVVAIGVFLGKQKIGKVSLGVTMVLFMGILVGHFGMTVEEHTLHFFKEFGLILFVFAVGLQVGPGFFSSLKKGGLNLNLIAIGVVFLGVAITVILHFVTGIPIPTMVGILCGAVTNTPGLGAAQQAFADMGGATDLAQSIPLGYAVAYPLGVIGILLSITLIRWILKIVPANEEKTLRDEENSGQPQASSASLVVQNAALFGKNITQLMSTFDHNTIVVSRHMCATTGKIEVAEGSTVLNENDRIFVIANQEEIDKLQTVVGPEVQMDRKQWIPTESNLLSHKYIITNKTLTGRRLGDLQLRQLYGVNATRLTRAGVDMVANAAMHLQVGDQITVVGSDASLAKVKELVGDSSKHLNEPNLIAIFLGIALGVMIGSIPIVFPGVPQPIKLGLAGGPLIVAILLSKFGHRVHMVTYTTASANLMIREIGIAIFLACVGIGAGNGFVDTLLGGGYVWVGYGFLITTIPLLIMGVVGRKILGINYFTLAGVMSGSMTDPPALAFSNGLTETDAPAVGYATVYPLTMFLRVLTAQMLILFLA